MTRRAKLLAAGGSSGALLLVLAVWLGLTFPPERIEALAVARAEATLEREVRADRLRIRLSPGPLLLPRPLIVLEGVTVSQGPGTVEVGDAPFATVERARVRVGMLPLLRGHVVIRTLEVVRPVVTLLVPAGGRLELPGAEGNGEPGRRRGRIRIDDLRLQQGRVVYRDENSGAVLGFTDLDQRMRIQADLAEGEIARLTAKGEISIGRVDADAPDALPAPVRAHSVTMDLGVEFRALDDLLAVRPSTVALHGVPIRIEGRVESLTDPGSRTVALRAVGHDLDLARAIDAVGPWAGPAAGREADPTRPSLRTVTGGAHLEATIEGRAGAGQVPSVDGWLRLDELGLARGGTGWTGGRVMVVEGLDGEIRFAHDRAATEGISGALLGEPFQLVFDLREPAAPQGHLTLRAVLDLDAADRLDLLPEGMRAGGRITADLRGEGGSIDEGFGVEGGISSTGVHLQPPGVLVPIDVADGTIGFSGREVAGRGLGATFGRSDVIVDFGLRDWTGLARRSPDPEPTGSLAVRSTLIDLDEAFGYDPEAVTYTQLVWAHMAGEPVEGGSAEDVARDRGLMLPDLPAARVEGGFEVGSLIHRTVSYEGIDADIALRGRGIDVTRARFRVMGGSVHLTARLEAPAEAGRPLTVGYAVRDVTADPFLERYTLFRGQVGGTLLLSGSVRTTMREDALPERETVVGGGAVAVVDGELRNWPLTRELGRRLGIGDLAALRFEDWSGTYRIVGASILIEESTLEAGDMAIRSAGSFDLAGNLDVGATVHVPGAWLEGVPGAPASLLAEWVGDPEGRVPVGARVTGTTSSPTIALDLSEAGVTAAERALEAAERAARERLERMAEELGLELPRRDRTGAERDSLREEVEAQVRTRLRRIFPPPDEN